MNNHHNNKNWHQSEQEYKGFTLLTLAKQGSGIKCHCLKDGVEIFTERFNFIKPDALLKRMCDKVDRYLNGTWIPKKILKQQNS